MHCPNLAFPMGTPCNGPSPCHVLQNPRQPPAHIPYHLPRNFYYGFQINPQYVKGELQMNENTYSYKPQLKGKSKFLLSIQKQSKCVAANFTQLSICQSSHTSSFRIRISPFPHMLEYGENVSYTFLQLLHSYLFHFQGLTELIFKIDKKEHLKILKIISRLQSREL